jgi:signal transduction histidine kinase
MFEIAILVTSSITNLLLGMTVYVKNPKSATGKLFLLLTGSFVLWSTINYFSLHPFLLAQVVWVRLVLVCAALLCLAVFLTFTTFPSPTLQGSPKVRKWVMSYTAFVMLLVLTPLVFTVNTSGEPTPTPAIAFFTLLAIGLIAASFVTLIKKMRHSAGVVRGQLRLVLGGLALTLGLIFVSNFLLVVVFGVHNLLLLGPAYTLIFSSTIAYAIIRHKLFDIRAAVARSVAYLLIVATMTLLYSAVLFGGINLLFRGSDKEVLRQLLSVVLVVPLAASFQYIKEFFARISSKIFYRVIYDSQVVLNELSTLLVHSLNIETLKTGSAAILRRSLTATNITYWLSDELDSNHETARHLDQMFDRRKSQSVVVVDEYGRYAEAAEHLRAMNIAVIVRLRTNTGNLGYLTLGYKESGEIYSQQDVQLLRIAADEIAISVQNSLHYEEIQRFNVLLQTRVDDATRKLRRTNEKLKSLDETKDDFISMASHQLRTPLTSVKGYLSMVLEGDAGKINATQAKMLGQAFTSSQRMVYLIADLLNVSRLKTGKFIIEAAPTNLAHMVSEEIDQLVETAASKQIELTYHQPEHFPDLMLDETKTRQVVMNFIDNAIYYTPSGGHIRVDLSDTPTSVEFKVSDDGIGVPKAEQHHLFTKFYRAGNARKARPDGTGLGLYMAKKVILAQGGSIIFQSKEGKGSTFGFLFPKDHVMHLNALPVAEAKESVPTEKTVVR